MKAIGRLWQNSHLSKRRERAVRNLRTTASRVRGRLCRPCPGIWSVGWNAPFLLILGMALSVSFLILDEAIGAYRGRWSGYVGEASFTLTDGGLGIWYIVPTILALVIVNQIDWTRYSGGGLLRLYNLTLYAAFALSSAGSALLLSNIVKRIIGRARPGHFEDHGAFAFDPIALDASWASFPSGHSATLGGIAGAAMLLWPGTRWVVLPVAMLLASTRIVVGAHYPSDVIAGFAFGLACAAGASLIFARLGYLFESRAGALPQPKKSARVFFRRRRAPA